MTLNIELHSSGAGLLDVVRPLYAEVYAEAPYNEGPADVDDFAANWTRYVVQPEFHLALARANSETIGFGFGYRLAPATKWWDGILDPVDSSLVNEYEGRTFAIIELAVRFEHRRHGVGRELHNALMRDRTEERVTLLVRPEAEPAVAAYKSWGYHSVSRIRPFPDAPIYIAMVRVL